MLLYDRSARKLTSVPSQPPCQVFREATVYPTMRPTRILLVTLAALLVAIPGMASAATTTNAPPGNSGISQYLEVVPSASGNKVKGDGKTSPLTHKEQKKLQQQGSDGQALQRIVNQTSPAAAPATTTPQPKPHKKARSVTQTTPTTTSSDDATSTQKRDALAVAAAYDGGSGGGTGSGIGVPLIALMAAAALAVGVIAIVRHRSGGGADPEPEL